MSEEIKKILRILTAKSTGYEYCLKENISYNDESYEAHLLLDYITNLQQKVEQLEKENKELNRMCELYGQSLYNADLTKAEKRAEQLENIRKEVMEYIEKDKLNIDESQCYVETQTGWKMIPKIYDDLSNILNKGSESNE